DAGAALARPVAAGGGLVLALHAGAEVRHVDEWVDHEVDLDVVLHDRAFVLGVVESAGLVDVEWFLRGPLTARGETTQRLYVVARKPA
ncbi:MAG: DUF480 domain-containing protein, partial [Nocardioidaceae bacterium]|nr:DUF480 domain-containing protein [Nocardioidaceae bacterium]